MRRGGLIAAACVVLIGVPALARAQGDPPATGDFQAVNDTPTPTWHANGASESRLTIATGGTVTFHYDSGDPSVKHNVLWQDNQPSSCSGMPGMYTPQPPGWSGSCTFSAPGTYAFSCIVHPYMTGKVVVEDPAPTPSVTPTPTPSSSATPAPTAAPTGTPDPPQSTLKGAVKLAGSQRGSRVRGSVTVQGAKSRLEVAVYAARSALSGGKSRARARVGRFERASAPAGDVAFSVPLSARARRALRKHRRLALTVSVALTPPGGPKLTRSLHATVRMT